MAKNNRLIELKPEGTLVELTAELRANDQLTVALEQASEGFRKLAESLVAGFSTPLNDVVARITREHRSINEVLAVPAFQPTRAIVLTPQEMVQLGIQVGDTVRVEVDGSDRRIYKNGELVGGLPRTEQHASLPSTLSFEFNVSPADAGVVSRGPIDFSFDWAPVPEQQVEMVYEEVQGTLEQTFDVPEPVVDELADLVDRLAFGSPSENQQEIIERIAEICHERTYGKTAVVDVPDVLAVDVERTVIVGDKLT